MDINKAAEIVTAIESVVSDNVNIQGQPLFAASIAPENVDNVSRYRVRVHAKDSSSNRWDDLIAAIKAVDENAWWQPIGGNVIEIRCS